MKNPLCIGDAVRARRQPWRIADIRIGDGCQVLTLRGCGPLNAGVERRVITPFETVERVRRTSRVRFVSMRRWRSACRALVTSHRPAGALAAAARARIALYPHQLEPALAILGGLGSRLLIADEVGLGKMIQAALIVTELIARGAADRVLVLTPAGLREQWAGELDRRFSLSAIVMDLAQGRLRAAHLPVGVNPWSAVPVVISSIDYVKRPEVLPSVRACRWDVLVVDEAHGVAQGSDRHDAVAALASAAAYVVLLTATPHNGDSRAFGSLCDLGRCEDDELLIFRRGRSDLNLGPKRRVHRLVISPSREERRMHTALVELTAAVGQEIATGPHQSDRRLALAVLFKRALSSAHALERSAKRRLDALTDLDVGSIQQLTLPWDDPSGELDRADEAPALGPLLNDGSQERRLMMRLVGDAGAAVCQQTKLAALERLLRRLVRRGERALVFTEYRDTLLHVRERLDAAGLPSLIIHGGLTARDRQAALDAFGSGHAPFLLATDAAGEGLNLQAGCRVVVNLELPWNPMRLEQRIGRVDRIGQSRSVHVFHLISSDTLEVQIFERLKTRLARADADVGCSADPLGVFDAAPEARTAVAPSLTRLEPEALAECARLERIRSLAAKHGPEPVESGADIPDDLLVARATRQRLRRQLSGRSLTIVQTRLDDEVGRTVAGHITPAVIATATAPPPSLRNRPAILNVLEAIETLDLDILDPSVRPWQERSIEAHGAFWGTRLRRERAIAHASDSAVRSPAQRGLFDQRSEHGHRAESEGRRQREAEFDDRLAAAERSGRPPARTRRTALFLVP